MLQASSSVIHPNFGACPVATTMLIDQHFGQNNLLREALLQD